jgi:hypothetical protein
VRFLYLHFIYLLYSPNIQTKIKSQSKSLHLLSHLNLLVNIALSYLIYTTSRRRAQEVLMFQRLRKLPFQFSQLLRPRRPKSLQNMVSIHSEIFVLIHYLRQGLSYFMQEKNFLSGISFTKNFIFLDMKYLNTFTLLV